MRKALLLTLPLALILVAQVLAGSSAIIASSNPIDQKPYWGISEFAQPEINWPKPEQGTPSEPRMILQGGDGIADAFAIGSLPFHETGSTAGYYNNWDPPCGNTFYGPDVVYAYTPATDQVVNIHLCGTEFYAILYLYENDTTNVLACSYFYDPCPPSGGLDLLNLVAGNTYYIVIDGYWSSQGNYTIDVAEQPQVDCPPDIIPEGEPDCGEGYVDNYNGGCNSNPPIFQDINIGDVICGNSGTYAGIDGRYRDTDWYQVTITETQVLKWKAVAEFPFQLFMFYANDCANLIDLSGASGSAGDTIEIEANCVPGTYYFFVAPRMYSEMWNCPQTYVAWLTSSPSGPAPDNDNCADVIPTPLIPGQPLVFTGDNYNATMDCVNLGMPETWVVFSLDVVANVTLDYCGTSPAFQTCFVVMNTSCPCGDRIMFNTYNQWECGDNNFKITWYDLPPGTYYYPVLAKRGVAAGPYTININATGYAEIGINPGEIARETAAGTQITQNLAIENTGYEALEYTVYVDQEPFAGLASLTHGRRLENPYFGSSSIIPKADKSSDDQAQGQGPHNRTILQGGEDIYTATPISELPYSDNGTTVGALDDYLGSCGNTGGLDVVYSFIPPYNMIVNISLCGSSFDTKLYIFANDENTEIDCNDDACNRQSELLSVDLTTGNTYYFVVDGFGDTDYGDYVINVVEVVPCIVECPPVAAAEVEICGDDFNGGCNSDPAIFESIQANLPLCGTAWADPSTRDTDWYELTLTDPTYLTFNGVAEFPIQFGLIDASQGCPVTEVLVGLVAPPCTTAVYSITLPAGAYWVFVAPYNVTNLPCDGSGDYGNNYYFTATTSSAWLSVDSYEGIVPVNETQNLTVSLDATHLNAGIYNGTLTIECNSLNDPISIVPVTFTVTGGGGCHYVVGDVNSNSAFNGIDVSYGVSYFKGGNVPPYSCECNGSTWYVAGDVNGSCVFNGIDITYMVGYFKGGPAPVPCPQCPPSGYSARNNPIVPTVQPKNINSNIGAE